MTLVLPINVKKGGVPADADSTPLLSDPTDAFGVKRTDTGAVVVANNTPMVRDGPGAYSYRLADPAAGVTYLWFAEVVVNGNTYHVERSVTAGPDPAAPLYATVQDVIGVYGEAKVAEISKASASQAGVDAARVTRALGFGDVRIHESLAAAGYLLPLADLSAEDAVRMREISVMLGFSILYGWRVGKDLDGEGRPTHPAKNVAKEAEARLRAIALGFVKLSATRKPRTPSGVAVVRR